MMGEEYKVLTIFIGLYWHCDTEMVFCSVLLNKPGLWKTFIKPQNFIQTQLIS